MYEPRSKSQEDGKQSNQSVRTILTVVMSWLIVSSLFFALESWSTASKFSDTGLPTLVAVHAFIAVFKIVMILYSIYGIIAVVNGSETMLEVLFHMTIVISMIGFIVLLGTTIPCSSDAARCDYKSHFSNLSQSTIGDTLAHLESKGSLPVGITSQISQALSDPQNHRDIVGFIERKLGGSTVPPQILDIIPKVIDNPVISGLFRARSMKVQEQWRNVQKNFHCCDILEPDSQLFTSSLSLPGISPDCPAKGKDWFMFVLAREYYGCLKVAEFRDQDGRYSLICDLITLLVVISSVLIYHRKNNRN